MLAITVPTPGGPDSLTLTDLDTPAIAEDRVLIDVVGIGINRADVAQRKGNYPSPPGNPEYPGLEVSGTVAHDVGQFRRGDEVVALLGGGGYAQQVSAPIGQVLPKPAGVSLLEAAAFPETAATVYSNMVMIGGLTAGQRLLVHGGAGGIGAMAIQLGKALGAEVVTTAGSAKKCEHALSLGADRAINYKEEDFAQVLEELGGADIILDVVGAGYLKKNMQALATNGKLIIIALQQGSRAEFDISTLMAKRGSVAATTLRNRPLAEKAEIMAGVYQTVWPLIATGAIKPVVDRVFAIEDAVQAHEYFDSGAHQGKVLLQAR